MKKKKEDWLVLQLLFVANHFSLYPYDKNIDLYLEIVAKLIRTELMKSIIKVTDNCTGEHDNCCYKRAKVDVLKAIGDKE